MRFALEVVEKRFAGEFESAGDDSLMVTFLDSPPCNEDALLPRTSAALGKNSKVRQMARIWQNALSISFHFWAGPDLTEKRHEKGSSEPDLVGLESQQ